VPASASLKAKRGVVKSVIARLRREVNCSVAEVAHQDLWQRAGLGVAVAASSEVGARKVAQQVEKIVSAEPRLEIITFDVQLASPEE
jgi:uncharacterized protein YlxP (DUF503 family)